MEVQPPSRWDEKGRCEKGKREEGKETPCCQKDHCSLSIALEDESAREEQAARGLLSEEDRDGGKICLQVSPCLTVLRHLQASHNPEEIHNLLLVGPRVFGYGDGEIKPDHLVTSVDSLLARLEERHRSKCHVPPSTE